MHIGNRLRSHSGGPHWLSRSVIASVVLGLVVGVFGCTDDEADPNPAFTGVTVTDEIGVMISEDLDDWRLVCPKAIPAPAEPLPAGVHPAFPNPATISTSLPVVVAINDSVSIQIWAAATRRADSEHLVRTIVAEWLSPGVHSIIWDCRNENGDRVAPGIYRCRYQLLGCSGYGDIEVSAIDAPSAAARQYAAEHWSLQRQLDACTGDIDTPGNYFYYVSTAEELPQWLAASGDDDAHFYAIGRCRQFAFGWDDYVDPRAVPALGPEFTYEDLSAPEVSPHREVYLSTK